VAKCYEKQKITSSWFYHCHPYFWRFRLKALGDKEILWFIMYGTIVTTANCYWKERFFLTWAMFLKVEKWERNNLSR
jgi:hypothetical protein